MSTNICATCRGSGLVGRRSLSGGWEACPKCNGLGRVAPESDEGVGRMIKLDEAVAAVHGDRGLKGSWGGASLNLDLAVAGARKRAAIMQVASAQADQLIAAAAEKVKAALGECESPIERALLPALVFADYGEVFCTFPAELHCPKIDHVPPTGDLVVIPQFAFVRYRLDFAIIGQVVDKRKIIAVECDGADFHQDTAKDWRRDQYLASFGIDVVRLSGTDIARDAIRAASIPAERMLRWSETQV